MTSAARLLVGGDLDERQLALDVADLVEVVHLDDADQLVELFVDLLDHLIVAVGHERDPRDSRIERFGDRQALDVEAPAAEQPGNAREHAELVLDEDRYGVTHERRLCRTSGGDASRPPAPRRGGGSTIGGGSGAAVTPEDLHDAIFAGELDLLDPLALQLFFRRQVVLVLERGELFLELEVLLVELPELRIPIEQRPYQLFVLSSPLRDLRGR